MRGVWKNLSRTSILSLHSHILCAKVFLLISHRRFFTFDLNRFAIKIRVLLIRNDSACCNAYYVYHLLQFKYKLVEKN